MSETIFMIHGMWCGAWYWENYKGFFEDKGYRCVTTTLRFHHVDPGETPHPRLGTTSLLDYAEDLEEEIRQLGDKPIIMGSLDGWAADADTGRAGFGQGPGSAESCIASRDHSSKTIGDKKLLERTHPVGLLEEAYAANV